MDKNQRQRLVDQGVWSPDTLSRYNQFNPIRTVDQMIENPVPPVEMSPEEKFTNEAREKAKELHVQKFGVNVPYKETLSDLEPAMRLLKKSKDGELNKKQAELDKQDKLRKSIRDMGGVVDEPESQDQPSDTASLPNIPNQMQPETMATFGSGNSIMNIPFSSSGYDQMQRAVLKEAESGAAQAVAESAYLDQTNIENERRLAQQEEKEAARHQYATDGMNQLNEKMEAFSKMPANFAQSFADASTGQKVIAGIALILGTLGTKEGENRGLEVMQNSIEQDLKKQKLDIDNRSSVYNQMLDTFQNERVADQATRLYYMDTVKSKIDSIASKYKAPQIQEKAKYLYGQIQVMEDQARNNLYTDLLKAADKGMSLDDQLKIRALQIPELGNAMARTETEAKEFRTSIADSAKADAAIGRMMEILGTPVKSLNPKLRAEATVLAQGLKGALRIPFFGPGPLSDTDQKFLQDVAKNPAKVFSFDAANKAALQEIQKKFKDDIKARARSQGIVMQDQEKQTIDPTLAKR